ncbi:hypothetical protein F5884DRAFT_758905 [Xylogone sp. PMI_703]|nr:hypothetical protein F5884DRAFT_758905 [Xylogone sp. PMI_703]
MSAPLPTGVSSSTVWGGDGLPALVSFHINVDPGDCATHLLVQDAAARPMVIMKAVLIDGGDPQETLFSRPLLDKDSTPKNRLLTCIDYIHEGVDYTFQEGAGFENDDGTPRSLKFDSIVITHWHQDHWGGIRDLMWKDFQDQIITRLTDGNFVTDQKLHRLGPLLTDAPSPMRMWHQQINLKSKYMKYDPEYKLPTKILQPDPAKYDRLKVEDAHRMKANESASAKPPTGSGQSGLPRIPDKADPDLNERPQPITSVTPIPFENLRTVFYVPYSYKTSTTVLPAADTTGRLGPSLSNIPVTHYSVRSGEKRTSPLWTVNGTDGYETASATDTRNILDVHIPINYTVSANDGRNNYPARKESKEVAMFTVLGVCKVVAYFEHYLGVELFSNSTLGVKWNAVQSPASLLDAHKRNANQGPGIFIVSGYTQVLGRRTFFSRDLTGTASTGPSSKSGSVKVVGLPARTQTTNYTPWDREMGNDPGNPESRDTVKGDAMNAVSLICVAIRSKRLAGDSANHGENDYTLDHYFGGDALELAETNVSNWLTTNDRNTNAGIKVMKLSHHGAAHSSPMLLLKRADPHVIIASNSTTLEYGHPPQGKEAGGSNCANAAHTGWEILFYIHALWNQRAAFLRSAGLPLRTKPVVFTTNSPRWLGPGVEDKDLPSERALWDQLSLDERSAFFAEYRPGLEDVYNNYPENKRLGGDSPNNLIAAFLRDFKVPAVIPVGQPKPSVNFLRLKRWIRNTVANKIWPQLSYTPPVGKVVLFYQVIVTQSRAQIRKVLHDTPRDQQAPFASSSSSSSSSTTYLNPPPPRTTPDQTASSSRMNTSMHEIKVPEAEQHGVPRQNFPAPTPFPSAMEVENPPLSDDADIEAGIMGIASTSTTGSGDVEAEKEIDTRRISSTLVRRAIVTASSSAGTITASTAPTVRATSSPPAGFVLGSDFLLGSADHGELMLKDPVISNFVAFLPGGVLALSRAFPSNGSSLDITLDASDGWFQRIRNNNIGITQATLTGKLDGSKADLSDLVITISTGGHTLNFSTANTATVLQFIVDPPAPGLLASIVPGYNVLVAALSSTGDTFTLSELLSTIIGTTHSLPGFGEFSMTLDASPGSGSALYFQADPYCTTDLRMTFKASGAESHFKQSFGWLASEVRFLHLQNTGFSIRKTAWTDIIDTQVTPTASCRVSLTTTVTIDLDSTTNPPTQLKFTTWLIFSEETTQAIFQFDPEQDVTEALDWMTQRIAGLSGLNLHPSSLLPVDNVVKLRQLDVLLNNPGSSTGFSLRSVSIDFEVIIFGASFKVTLTWPDMMLEAELWLVNAPLAFPSLRMLPFHEAYDELAPSIPRTSIHISDLLPGSPALPSGIPGDVTDVKFSSWKQNNSSGFQIEGRIQCIEPAAKPAKMPILRISELALQASYDFIGKAFDVTLSTTIYMFARQGSPYPPARVDLSVEYGGSWTINCSLVDLNLASLYSLFDSDSGDSVMNVMEHFEIMFLDVTYHYSPDQQGQASQFSCMGVLVLGPFELALQYIYSDDWTFQAYLGARDSGRTTLGVLVENIAGPSSNIVNLLNEVPFVRDINIPAVAGSDSGFKNAPVQLEVKKTDTHLVFWFQLNINTSEGRISMTFIQLQNKAPVNGQPLKPKRIIRVVADKIPSLPKVPVVGSLPSPFDMLEYLWIQDPNATVGTQAGFTRAEIAMVNGALTDPIRFRDPMPPSTAPGTAAATPPANDVPVLLSGHHFVVTSSGQVMTQSIMPAKIENVVIDNTNRAVSKVVDPDSAANNDSGTTFGSTKKSVGSLSIQNIGIQLKDGYLYVHVDATIALGPIQMTLVGFAIGLPLSDFNFNKLGDIRLDDLHVRLDGMNISLNSPPLLVAGMFVDKTTATSELYQGGISLSIMPYTLLAIGAYERVFATPTTREHKSVFVFARLDGPLLTLEFAEVTGVKAGFGYNSLMKLPDIAQVTSFPLVESSTVDGSNPMAVLASFNTWVSAQDGPLWLAIGMKIFALEVLSLDAALLLSFNPTPVIAIVADAIATMPPDTPRQKCFLYVEIGMIAALDIAAGSLRVEAQLSPNSFILYPACHLTGGFALCYWFGFSPFAGDFVFTVGGYHPAYKAPAHYPNPPSGEAFFAIMPKACMGGGRLLAVFNAGVLGAHFEAWASFLINFKPFFFIGDIGVSVGVSFEIDFWIIHIHIGVDLGAKLRLQGPPFGGFVHVDFYVFGFDIYFGDQNNDPGALDWDAFLALVKQPGPSTTDITKSNPNLLLIVIEQGSVDEKTVNGAKITGDKWYVRAGSFKFRVESKFALSQTRCGDGTKSIEEDDPNTKLNPNPIYARPMRKDVALTSTLDVEITFDTTASSVTGTVPVVNPAADDNSPWNLLPLMKKVPKAIWDKYISGDDPVNGGGNNITSILDATKDASSIEHLLGLTISSPNPRLPAINMEPFNALEGMQEDVFKSALNPVLPPSGDVQMLFVPAPHPTAMLADLPSLWENVREAWTATDADASAAQALALTWTKQFAWDDPALDPASDATLSTSAQPPTVPAHVFTPLVSNKPAYVLAKENFGMFYLEVPFVTVQDTLNV